MADLASIDLSQNDDCTDNGKPAVRQGRKAVNLCVPGALSFERPVWEIVWLPKAIGENQ